ncbi:unnamed protein product [Polarella glacialis]|uniref:Uncharacterized protein n=1 Tax=Polarella glacialis TaxID=89957 RepID=A0A813DQ78_POLGL|nr:unnamed protein product [Polarella glacialis]
MILASLQPAELRACCSGLVRTNIHHLVTCPVDSARLPDEFHTGRGDPSAAKERPLCECLSGTGTASAFVKYVGQHLFVTPLCQCTKWHHCGFSNLVRSMMQAWRDQGDRSGATTFCHTRQDSQQSLLTSDVTELFVNGQIFD